MTLASGVLPLCKSAVGVFYSPIQLGKQDGGYDAKRMSPLVRQRYPSPDAGRRNLIGERPKSNSYQETTGTHLSGWSLLI